MDEDFLDVTESGNKKGIIIFILIVIFFAVFGYFFVYQKYYFSLKTVSVELGSTLSEDINDYLNKALVDTSGYTLNTRKVNTSEIGEYTYTVSYGSHTKKGKIKVVDTTAPVFEVQDLSVEVGDDDFFLGDALTSCSDASMPCIVTFKNESDEDKINTVGTYQVTIVVSDLYKNSKESEITLNVVEAGTLVDEKALDLEYASNSLEIEDFNESYYYKKLDKALPKDGETARDEESYISTIDLEEYVTNHYEGYTLKESQIIEVYNKSSYIIGFAIRLTISNGTEKYVYVTEE